MEDDGHSSHRESRLRTLFGKLSGKEEDVTEEEIIKVVTEGQEQGLLQDTEADMITNIFAFSDKEAKEIMTQRGEIDAIDGNATLSEAIHIMLEGNNSRFPVYEDSIDHIIGIVHIRDAMKLNVSEDAGRDDVPIRKLRGLLRQAVHVPETRNIDALFRSMQASKTQMVIVIDEYGQTAGLVTMEDIVEEIFGNIMDEYDEDERYIEAAGTDGEYLIDGKTPLEMLTDRFGIEFGEEEVETINGLMISKLDRIPQEDERFSVDIGSYNFRILEVANHMIARVLMTERTPQEEKNAQEETGEMEKAGAS